LERTVIPDPRPLAGREIFLPAARFGRSPTINIKPSNSPANDEKETEMTTIATKTHMTESEKLERDITGIRESIRLNWIDLDKLNLSPAERAGVKESTRLLNDELQGSIARLERLEGRNS
jgi:hypothetical protein